MLQEHRVFTHFVRGPLMGCLPHGGHRKNSAGPQGRAVCLLSLPPVPEKSGEGGRSREDRAAIPNFPPQVLASWDEDKVSWEMPTRPEVSKQAGMHFKICSHLKGTGDLAKML